MRKSQVEFTNNGYPKLKQHEKECNTDVEQSVSRKAQERGKAYNVCKLALRKPQKHTVRVDASGLWAKRCEEVNSGKKILSVREWTERPYRSEQRELKKLSQIGLQYITMTYSSDDALPQCWIDNKRVPVEDVASNDGLSVDDFVDYFFGKCGCKSNVFEGVIIHFTDFRY